MIVAGGSDICGPTRRGPGVFHRQTGRNVGQRSSVRPDLVGAVVHVARDGARLGFQPAGVKPRVTATGRPLGRTAQGSRVDFQQEFLLEINMSNENRTELLQGTLDLLVLKTLATLGSLHGFGIARRIEQMSGDTVLLNQGTIYPALVRLEDQGWIGSAWGVSENNRRARFYTITAAGRRQLREEVANWQRVTALVDAVLTAET